MMIERLKANPRIRYHASIALYYFARLVLWALSHFKILEKGWASRALPSHRIEQLFVFLFNRIGYRGNYLSDLESYTLVGDLRYKWRQKCGQCVESRKFQDKPIGRKLRIGFFGIFGREAVFPLRFFKEHPSDVEVYIYDLIRPEAHKTPYEGTQAFDGLEGVRYYKTPSIKPYWESEAHYDEVLSKLESDELDILVVTLHSYALTLIDKLSTPMIFSLNVTSLPMPHPKCSFQSYIQPSWPYSTKGDRILNLKTGQTLAFPRIHDRAYIYGIRAAKHFQAVPLGQRKAQVFFAGHARKLISGEFSEIVAELMQRKPELKLVYYGPDLMIEEARAHFKQHGFLDRSEYRGYFEQRLGVDGNYVLTNEVKRAFTDLSESMLFLNPFPELAARSCMEAYALDVPVVYMDVKLEHWLEAECKKRVPIRCPMNNAKSGTAYSLEEYLDIALRIMDDEAFAEQIILEQRDIINRLSDGTRFWDILSELPRAVN